MGYGSPHTWMPMAMAQLSMGDSSGNGTWMMRHIVALLIQLA